MLPVQQKKIKWAAAISFVALGLVCLFSLAGVNQRLELMAFDAMAKLIRSDTHAHPDVAVVLIDEASLKAMNQAVGRWPWPRFVYADLLDFIYAGEPAAVAFDVLFTENDGFNEDAISDNDLVFVQATASASSVYHAQQIVVDVDDEYNKNLLGNDMPEDFRQRFSVARTEDMGEANNFYLPFPELYDAAGGMGVVEFSPDVDGGFRRTRPVRQYKQDMFPVMGIAPLFHKLDIQEVVAGSRFVQLDDIKIPLGADGQYLINMYGKYNTYSVSGLLASFQSLANGDYENMIVDPEEFKDKVVFIGASAAGVEDMKPTSISESTPGVFLHASLLSNVLGRDFLVPYSSGFSVFMAVLLAATTAFSTLLISKQRLKVAVPVALAAAYVIIVLAGYSGNRLFALVPPLSALTFSFIGSYVYLSLTEGREKRKVRKMLGQYVSPHMLASLVDSGEDMLRAEVGAEEDVSILFSDIRGFTSISENEPADRIVSMLNQYFTLWSDAIFEYDGTIDKFVGDAVMALWGAPLRTDRHPELAIRAALRVLETLPVLNKKLGSEGYPEIKIGVGVHTGNAILGNIGSDKKLDYTVIGDTVNLASRLEGLTKQYACDILISEATHDRVKDMFECEYVDDVKVKGKERSVRIFKVVS